MSNAKIKLRRHEPLNKQKEMRDESFGLCNCISLWTPLQFSNGPFLSQNELSETGPCSRPLRLPNAHAVVRKISFGLGHMSLRASPFLQQSHFGGVVNALPCYCKIARLGNSLGSTGSNPVGDDIFDLLVFTFLSWPTSL